VISLFNPSSVIVFSAKPSAPLDVTVSAVGSTAVNASWCPPLHSSQCIDHYVVSVVNEIEMSTQNNSTTLVINQLQQGMNYMFRVRGVDSANRTGEESEAAKITMDGK